MRAPTVHLNGTSGERLDEQLRAAHAALRAAVRALEAAAPNGRDYYPQGPTALAEALLEHRGRMERLQSVADEVAGIHEALDEQLAARARQQAR